MSKNIFVFLLAFSCVSISKAQQAPDVSGTTRKQLLSRVEIIGGPNFSFLRGNTSVDNTFENTRKIRNGISIGVGFYHRLNRSLDLNVKILYEQKGGISETVGAYYDTTSQSLKQGTVQSNYRYDYYSMPILLDYRFGKRQQFSVGVGPFASYLQKQIVTQKFLFSGSIDTFDRIAYNTKFDLGLALKIGFNISLTEKRDMSLQLLNTLGLNNTSLVSNPGQKTNSNTTSLMIGIILK